MSTDYNYDEKGQFFPYFVITLAGIVTVPLTYSLLAPSKGESCILSPILPSIPSLTPLDIDFQTWRAQRRG